MSELGRRIRDLRIAKGLSRPELAAKAGISGPYLWRIEVSRESGEGTSPSGATLTKLAQPLEVSVSQLLGESPAQRVSHHSVLRRTRENGQPHLQLSESLTDYIRRCQNGKEPITKKEIRGLAAVNSKGKVPATAEDWDFIMQSIRRAIG